MKRRNIVMSLMKIMDVLRRIFKEFSEIREREIETEGTIRISD
jgi:hypothetical protein